MYRMAVSLIAVGMTAQYAAGLNLNSRVYKKQNITLGGVNLVEGVIKTNDLVLTGVPTWGSIPTAFANTAGDFNIQNRPVPNFPGWASHPRAKVLQGDFNGDGRGDLAATGVPGWNTIPVALSNGNGTFNVVNGGVASWGNWAANYNAKPLTGDFNGDGKKDIALVGEGTWGSIPVAYGQANGTFRITNANVPNFPGWSQVAGAKPQVGDFDHNGSDDIALVGGLTWGSIPVAFFNSSGFWKLTNQGVPNFPKWAAIPQAQAITGDYNGDGNADIALTGVPNWNTIPVAFSNGNGTFNVTNVAAGSFPTWASDGNVKILVGNFNSDSRSDLALIGGPTWNTVPIALSLGAGNWTIQNPVVPTFPAIAADPQAKPVIGDFNGDRRDDVALLGVGGTTIPLIFGTNAGGWGFKNSAAGSFQNWSRSSIVKTIGAYSAPW